MSRSLHFATVLRLLAWTLFATLLAFVGWSLHVMLPRPRWSAEMEEKSGQSIIDIFVKPDSRGLVECKLKAAFGRLRVAI